MNIFTFIKSQLSIVDVVGEYVTLHKAGAYLKSRCPFHHEKTGSFTVSPDKEIFYCFGCHTGGDLITFMAKAENCSPIEAAHFLVERYQLKLPQDLERPEHAQDAEEKKVHYEVCRLFATWCHQQLQKHPTILHYLTQRDIEHHQINQFMIGFFPGGMVFIKQCIQALKKEHILLDDLEQAHIIMQGKSVWYSPFEDRIIFPIKDHLGRFCAFGGRIYKPQDTRPKYYNSKESEFFTKGSILFGLDSAKKAIQERKSVFLVEGYTDCIAMVQHGYPNTVATLGTACTEQHLKLLARYADYLDILYDSDSAGQQAIMRLMKLCFQANMELRVISLPPGQDPASFLSAGTSLESAIAQAQDIFNFFISSLHKEFAIKPLHEKVRTIRSLIETIQTIEDPLKQDILLQNAARTFDIPLNALTQELGQQQKNRASIAGASSSPHTHPNNSERALGTRASADESLKKEDAQSTESVDPSVFLLEKRIVCAILNNRELLKSLHETYVIEYLSSPLKEILHSLKTSWLAHSSFEFSTFFDTLSEREKQQVSQLILEQNAVEDKASYEYLIQQFQKKQWKRIVRDITTQLTNAQKRGDHETIQRILHDFHALKEKIIPHYW